MGQWNGVAIGRHTSHRLHTDVCRRLRAASPTWPPRLRLTGYDVSHHDLTRSKRLGKKKAGASEQAVGGDDRRGMMRSLAVRVPTSSPSHLRRVEQFLLLSASGCHDLRRTAASWVRRHVTRTSSSLFHFLPVYQRLSVPRPPFLVR